ncbi:hypothetical protein EGY05_22370 [Chryseobacterium arthrosphaerae]|uniref:hypothetical protein n=1 Tax=Chryseobacterium arthrosphaerae TaxID=651561 RepID=UPI000F4EF247|nr:hypothetical protein [Chryseobacterium arthrosphaerae]AYZ14498.1 hypothetical protein EGY05_22370 [Chryseobacterium arthrosphaerae]
MSLEILNNPLLRNVRDSFPEQEDFYLTGPIFPGLESPQELKQKTSKQIANTYYGGKPVLSSNGFLVYSDEPVFGGDIEEVAIYKSRFSQVIAGINVVLFASKNGAFLLQRYMEALPDSNELILFLEIDGRYNHNTVMRAVAGAELTNKKDFPFADIFNFTRRHSVTVEPKVLKNLIEKGIYRNKVSFISWFLGLKDAGIGRVFSFFKQTTLEGASNFFIKGIAENITRLRIPENGWNPYPKEGEYEPAVIPKVFYKEIKAFYENEASENPYENQVGQQKIISRIIKSLFEKINEAKADFKNLLKNGEAFFPDFIYKRVSQSLNLFFNQLDKLEKLLADPLSGMQHIVYRNYQIANAFLCGIYNSLIDIIAGIFSIIGFIFKAVATMDKVNDRKVEYGEMFMELMEDLMESILTFDYIDFFRQCINFQIKTIIRLVTWVTEKFPQVMLEKAAYYYGYIIGIIIDVIIETLLTGGAAAVAKLAKSVESFILNPLEKISKAITKTENALNRIIEFIQMLLREFKKGTKEIFSKLEKVLDEVFGFGEEVADHGITSAEKRVKDKQKRIQETINRKNDPVKRKRIKQHEDFIKKWSGKSIKSLTKTEIANALKGFTEQGNRIAKLIEEEKIIIHILDDDKYIKLCMEEYGDTFKQAMNTHAFADGIDMYFRSSRNPDVFLSELIHEGTHAKEANEIIEMLKNGKTEEQIREIIGNNWSSEKRAFFHEHAWQEATGMEKDFDTIEAMLENIFTNYDEY